MPTISDRGNHLLSGTWSRSHSEASCVVQGVERLTVKQELRMPIRSRAVTVHAVARGYDRPSNWRSAVAGEAAIYVEADTPSTVLRIDMDATAEHVAQLLCLQLPDLETSGP